jgi:hypothetical protein
VQCQVITVERLKVERRSRIVSLVGGAAVEGHDQLRRNVALEQVVLAVTELPFRHGSDLESGVNVRVHGRRVSE